MNKEIKYWMSLATGMAFILAVSIVAGVVLRYYSVYVPCISLILISSALLSFWCGWCLMKGIWNNDIAHDQKNYWCGFSTKSVECIAAENQLKITEAEALEVVALLHQKPKVNDHFYSEILQAVRFVVEDREDEDEDSEFTI